MGIDKADDIKYVAELLNLKNELTEDESLKDVILKEGIIKRLKEKLGIQSTLLGRIEPVDDDFEFIYLKELDDKKLFDDYQIDEQKQTRKVPIKVFLEKLKAAFISDYDSKIIELEKLKKELDLIF
jgi:hypothetical protein